VVTQEKNIRRIFATGPVVTSPCGNRAAHQPPIAATSAARPRIECWTASASACCASVPRAASNANSSIRRHAPSVAADVSFPTAWQSRLL
jgi:hypothetical protein